jgi:uncharacterized spore protein YtfJ
VSDDAIDALARLDGVKDALTVRRVFGEPYESGGATIIPVARVRGGGGGGSGEGTSLGDDASGSGSGYGFGMDARPVGVFVVRDGVVSWQPAIDVMRIVVGGQLLALAGILVVGHLLRRRRH